MELAVLTLGVTTSTSVMGVAVGIDGAVMAQRIEPTDRRHAERLIPLIQDVVADTGHGLRDVERLAVDVGPGLFTGLRVGLATVGGLARALDVEVVTATSLFLVAAGAGIQGDLLAVIDARRGEVFAQRFTGDGLRVEATGPAGLLDPSAGLAGVPASPAVGDGAVRYRDRFEAIGCVVSEGVPSVAELVAGADGFETSPTRVPAPCYLREPDARIGAWTTRST